MSLSVAEIATLVHGYTMRDVEKMSIAVSRKLSYLTAIDEDERRSLAWFGIVQLLYSSPEEPSQADLYNAARRAVADEASAQARQHGRTHYNQPAPRFTTYWMPRTGARDFTDALVEHMALPQVLAVLSPKEYEALAALASFGTQQEAADALGISMGSFQVRITNARYRAVRAWFDDETPRSMKGIRGGDTCRAGHARAEHSFVNASGNTECRTCTRNAKRRRRARSGSQGDSHLSALTPPEAPVPSG